MKAKVSKKQNQEQSQEHNLSAWRYMFVISIMLVVGGFLSYRALNIQVLDNEFLQSQGNARYLRTIDLPAHRGMILDRNDEVLAISTPVASVWANPKTVPEDHENLKQLSILIDRPLDTINDVLEEKSDKGFIYLRRHINPNQARKVKELGIPGVSILREFRRYYPAGEVAAHVVGFTNIDDEGLEGIELDADSNLKGEVGQDKVIKDRTGRIIDSIDFIRAPQPGENIHLSIDKRLQYVAYRELKKAMIEHKAKTASLVVLDALSGEILAMVNQPGFNPNNYKISPKSQYRNLTVTDLFEPGSTIKPFIAAAALTTQQFSAHTPVNTAPGYMRVGRATIRDVHNYGQLDLAGVIKKSSNVGIVKVSLAIEKENLWEMLSDYGFGELTGSHFPGEATGYLPFFGEWKKLTQATLSFGYGISTTPLQLAQAYALFANKGYLKPVSLYRLDEVPEGKQVMSEQVSLAVLNMMEAVVSREGTAVEAKIPGYRVAGKTGTMKKLGEDGQYLEDKYMSVFVGIAPVAKPRLVGVVLFDDPSNGDYYGGKVAAPVFSKVMSEALRLLNIAPDGLAQPELRMAKLTK